MKSVIFNFILSFGGLIAMLTAGFIFGRLDRKRHFARMEADDLALTAVHLFNQKPEAKTVYKSGELVVGSVVISVDFFSQVITRFRMLFGGDLPSYKTSLERGRREALIRLKQQAACLGASAVYNIKVQSSPIGTGTAVEIYTYGTAVID